MRLLQQGLIDHVLVSVPGETDWGEWVPDMARRYIAQHYSPETAARTVLCETDRSVNSTGEEAAALRRCLQDRGWRSIVVVTSNFHSRRAQLIWRRAVANANPPFEVSVHGVSDGDFEPAGWWRKRLYAKTWILELTKLVWTCLFESGHTW
jgi:uncharacterized SAM-binding protein YcdF (DUF218 family)